MPSRSLIATDNFPGLLLVDVLRVVGVFVPRKSRLKVGESITRGVVNVST